MKKKIIRKADIILFVVLMLSAGILFARPFLSFGDQNSSSLEVVIRRNGEVVGKYPLNEDREVQIDGDDSYNLILIQDRSVRMEESSCKNQVCVDQGEIRRSGQSIICLPNRVVVEITGSEEEEDGVDAVAQ